MAVLVVDDVASVTDVVELITYLTRALAEGETDDLLGGGTLTLTRASTPSAAELADLVRLGEVESCTDPAHRPGCSCIEDAVNTEPRQLARMAAARHVGPVPYLPCPRRGQHHRLTECWMCWSDVHRGALTLAEVLRDGGTKP